MEEDVWPDASTETTTVVIHKEIVVVCSDLEFKATAAWAVWAGLRDSIPLQSFRRTGTFYPRVEAGSPLDYEELQGGNERPWRDAAATVSRRASA